jgi:hypothetical protein
VMLNIVLLENKCRELTMSHLPCKFLISTFAGAAMMSVLHSFFSTQICCQSPSPKQSYSGV